MTAWGNSWMTALRVILTMLLVRIPAFREKRVFVLKRTAGLRTDAGKSVQHDAKDRVSIAVWGSR